MDKDGRLRRYRTKKYSDIVAFPVEIVGRDGEVRQFPFDASIRLYQRRLRVAETRYPDRDLARAEAGHCRARIEQLRRSYFHLHGWSLSAAHPSFEGRFPELAGELAGFLMRSLRVTGRLDLRLTELDGPGPAESLWYLTPAHGPPLVLYTYRFSEGAPGARCEGKTAFDARRRALRGGDAVGGDGERLVSWHAVDDCGFILTGRADDVAGLVALLPDTDDTATVDTPWEDVLALAQRGDVGTAWVRCRWLIDEQPWHREAHTVGAWLALALGRASDAEDVAWMGTRRFPKDALLHVALGLARLADGRPQQALSNLDDAIAVHPTLAYAHSLRALAALRTGAFLAALRANPSGPLVGEPRDLMLHAALRSSLRRGAGVGVVLLCCLAGGLAASVAMGPWALLLTAAVLVCAAVAVGALRYQLDGLHAALLDDDLSAALRRVRRRLGQAPALPAPDLSR